MRAPFTSGIFFLALIGAALAGPLENGIAAYDRGDYPTAMRLFAPSAERGDAWAQSYVGFMYWEGLGVAQNFATAAQWSQLAADKGNGDAQQNLAMAYKNGWGFPVDYVEAHMWFNLASMYQKTDDLRNKAAMERNVLATRMTPAQVAEAQLLASTWSPK
jgi:uncharacterized protein